MLAKRFSEEPMEAVKLPNPAALQEYWLDAWQRSVLFLDILRERGNIYHDHNAQEVPEVLSFETELIRDGRTLERPVNYGLVRIVPPPGTKIDPAKPPIIVVDPRAGHGPGIGGMKQESEIGVALADGHPCYFVGFLPEPMPGQTVEDVCRAEAVFIDDVAARHQDAEGRPVVIANCQAGWQIMIMAALNPGHTGPILLAGSPLSYWAGVHGKNPMRYLGGMLGGTWLTALAGDIGHGIFDGANLVANFESLNPANTYWTKAYNVWSKADTEAARFLDFETWWGSPVLLNANEMQWIADNLFVGNRLATGELRASDGMRVDLRNITAPIVVFCSWGDNITPPQQALDWVLDLYASDRELIANGQTIVYTMHQNIGHLGIFVSGKVASKEHGELVSCMDLIDALPPGLYEAVITEVNADTANPELVHGKYLFQLKARGLDDIRALGGNDAADDARFATVARVSEINHGLYEALAGPIVRGLSSTETAEAMRQAHPNRLRFAAFSDRNPLMKPVGDLADSVRASRRPVSPDNPLLAMEHAMSSWITNWLETCGELRDSMTETMFMNMYGSPLLQAMVGLGPSEVPPHQAERDLLREAREVQQRTALEQRFAAGGIDEAVLRALAYVRLADGSLDERGFSVLKKARTARHKSVSEFKAMLREQYLLVRLDEARALATLPALIGEDQHERRAALDLLHRVLSAGGKPSDAAGRRLHQVEAMFAVNSDKAEVAGE
jgi:hypothetical protein